MFLHALFVDVKVRWSKKKKNKQTKTNITCLYCCFSRDSGAGKDVWQFSFLSYLYIFSPLSVFLEVEVRGRKDKQNNKHFWVAAQGKGVVIFLFLSFSYIGFLFSSW